MQKFKKLFLALVRSLQINNYPTASCRAPEGLQSHQIKPQKHRTKRQKNPQQSKLSIRQNSKPVRR